MLVKRVSTELARNLWVLLLSCSSILYIPFLGIKSLWSNWKLENIVILAFIYIFRFATCVVWNNVRKILTLVACNVYLIICLCLILFNEISLISTKLRWFVGLVKATYSLNVSSFVMLSHATHIFLRHLSEWPTLKMLANIFNLPVVHKLICLLLLLLLLQLLLLIDDTLYLLNVRLPQWLYLI